MLGNNESMNASDGHESVVVGKKCTSSRYAEKVFIDEKAGNVLEM